MFIICKVTQVNESNCHLCNVNDYLSVMKTLCIHLYRKMVETETVMNTLYNIILE